MNKQTIKVLLVAGALGIAAMFGGCGNGTTTEVQTEYNLTFGTGGRQVTVYAPSGLSSTQYANLETVLNNISADLIGQDFANAALPRLEIYVKDVLGSNTNNIQKNSFEIKKSLFDVVGTLDSTIHTEVVLWLSANGGFSFLQQFDPSKETVRLAFGKQGNAGAEQEAQGCQSPFFWINFYRLKG